MVGVLLSQVLVVGALFVYASFFEWSLHRFLMHRPTVVTYPFRTHTLTHHRNFRSDASYHLFPGQSQDSLTFAWWNAPLLIGVHLPVLWGVERFCGVPVVWTGMATLGLYYWLYEYGHWCMHVPKDRWIERTRAFRWLDAHHRGHHRLYAKNLNVVFPLADYVFRTRRRFEWEREEKSFCPAGDPSRSTVENEAVQPPVADDQTAARVGDGR